MEKVYQSMKSAGIFNLVMGIATILFGAVAGSFASYTGQSFCAGKTRSLFRFVLHGNHAGNVPDHINFRLFLR